MADDRDLTGPVFRTKTTLNQRRLAVSFSGCLDGETAPQLRAFLNQLTNDLSAGIVSTFEIDITQLYLLSSAAISCLAAWIKQVKDLYPECRVRFRTNSNLVWQQRALGSIRRLAENIVSIE